MTSKHETSDADYLIEVACDVETANTSAAGALGAMLREIAERLRDAPTMETVTQARQSGGNTVRDEIRGLVLADRSLNTRLALVLAAVGMGSIPRREGGEALHVPKGTRCDCGDEATRYITLTDGSGNLRPYCDQHEPIKCATCKDTRRVPCGKPDCYEPKCSTCRACP